MAYQVQAAWQQPGHDATPCSEAPEPIVDQYRRRGRVPVQRRAVATYASGITTRSNP